MGQLEECSICLENSLTYFSAEETSLIEQSIAQRMKKLRIECKLRMQLCAILSQLHRHCDALEQAKGAVRLSHQLIKDLNALCDYFIQKERSREQYEEQLVNELQGGGSVGGGKARTPVE